MGTIRGPSIPKGTTSFELLLERDCVQRTSRSAGNAGAVTPEQQSRIGNQTGGRVFPFLHTDDFQRDFHDLTARGVRFVRPPKEEDYGTVAVFEDLYSNLWDLLQLRDQV